MLNDAARGSYLELVSMNKNESHPRDFVVAVCGANHPHVTALFAFTAHALLTCHSDHPIIDLGEAYSLV
jgi:hypothetical protein